MDERPRWVPLSDIEVKRAAVATTAFPDDNVIYVSASNNKTKFFEGKTFKKDGSVWKNFEGTVQTPIYWPLGGTGSFDFLAFSTTLPATASWGDGDPTSDDDVAGLVVINYPSNYEAPAAGVKATQDDLLYATTSSSSRSTALPIEFKHALAWVNFMVKSNIKVNIKKIELVNAYLHRGHLHRRPDLQHPSGFLDRRHPCRQGHPQLRG